MAAVGACAGFGSICGSSLATAATMAQVALPELRRHGYAGGLATATLAAGGDEPALLFPAPLLRAVLSNLIRNSLQYAGPQAGIVITAGPDFVQVKDDGPGIAVERQASIFSAFVRGEQPDDGNLGLGLSLVQRICEHQGWRVSLHSRPGQGSQFRVDLAGPAPTPAR